MIASHENFIFRPYKNIKLTLETPKNLEKRSFLFNLMKLNIHLFKYEMLFALANKSILLSTSFFVILIFTVGIGFGQTGDSSEKTVIAIIWIATALSSLLSIKKCFKMTLKTELLTFTCYLLLLLKQLFV